jgi:benzaldehyde dehydrogenase (NAD)
VTPFQHNVSEEHAMTILKMRDWEEKIFSGGWIDGSGESFDSREPATGDTLGRVGAATADDLSRAVERAAQAQRQWASLPYVDRAQVLRRAARVFEENHAEIADWIVRESGALRPVAAGLHASRNEAPDCRQRQQHEKKGTWHRIASSWEFHLTS